MMAFFKKTLLVFFLFFLIAALAAAEKALIWKVTRKGDPGKLYLVGSIHLGKASWYPLDSVYDKTLSASDEMFFEIFKPDTQRLALMIATQGMYPPDQSLKNVMGVSQFNELCRYLEANGSKTPPFALEKMRPWLAFMELAGVFIRKEKNLKAYCGLEKVFTAHQGQRPAHSLESVDSQMRAMASIPDAVMTASIMKSIRMPGKATQELTRTITAFDRGDITVLTDMCNEIAKEEPIFYQKLFFERNQQIAGRLLPLLKNKKTYFILVGAGHFAGKNNIRDLLTAKNCTVVQLNKTGIKGTIRPVPPKRGIH